VRGLSSSPGVFAGTANIKTSWHAAADRKSWNGRSQRRPGLTWEYYPHSPSSSTPQGSRTYHTLRLSLSSLPKNKTLPKGKNCDFVLFAWCSHCASGKQGLISAVVITYKHARHRSDVMPTKQEANLDTLVYAMDTGNISRS